MPLTPRQECDIILHNQQMALQAQKSTDEWYYQHISVCAPFTEEMADEQKSGRGHLSIDAQTLCWLLHVQMQHCCFHYLLNDRMQFPTKGWQFLAACLLTWSFCQLICHYELDHGTAINPSDFYQSPCYSNNLAKLNCHHHWADQNSIDSFYDHKKFDIHPFICC